MLRAALSSSYNTRYPKEYFLYEDLASARLFAPWNKGPAGQQLIVRKETSWAFVQITTSTRLYCVAASQFYHHKYFRKTAHRVAMDHTGLHCRSKPFSE